MKTSLVVLIAIVVLIIAVGIFVVVNKQTNLETDTGAGAGNSIGNNNQQSSDQSSSGAEQTQTSETPQTYNIEIKGFTFSPSTLTIKKGDTVIWINKDSVSHTVTSDSENELDSALLSNGESYSHTFNEEGTFNYHCAPHSYMKGKIIVE